MGSEGGAAVDEVAQLFEAYKIEHSTSKLTLPQFRQIYAMRQMEKAKEDEKEQKRATRGARTAEISLDNSSMHKTTEEATQEASAAQESAVASASAKRAALKLHSKRKAALLMARLHERVPPQDQQLLMDWCRCALKAEPPTLTLPELGNKVISLCEKHLREDDAGMDLECDLRELFAELLDSELDAFNEQTGGIPRRLFATMLARHRRKNAQVSRELGIPEDEGEAEENDGAVNARTGVRYRGDGACEDLRPSADEAEYLRRLELLAKLPQDKIEKFVGGTPFHQALLERK